MIMDHLMNKPNMSEEDLAALCSRLAYDYYDSDYDSDAKEPLLSGTNVGVSDADPPPYDSYHPPNYVPSAGGAALMRKPADADAIEPEFGPSHIPQVTHVRQQHVPVTYDYDYAVRTFPMLMQQARQQAPLIIAQRMEQAQANLGKACREGDVAGARKAVEDGADVDADVFTVIGAMGGPCTAAYVAARWGSANVFGDVLLPSPVSADPNKGHTNSGWTPCHIACQTDHPDAVTVLLVHGADPNRANKGGVTPCMLAARNGHTACIRALSKGAARRGVVLDVNAVIPTRPGEILSTRTALDLTFSHNKLAHAHLALLTELGALRAADLPQPKRPKSARKT